MQPLKCFLPVGYEPKLHVRHKTRHFFNDSKNNLRSSKSFPDLPKDQNLTQEIV